MQPSCLWPGAIIRPLDERGLHNRLRSLASAVFRSRPEVGLSVERRRRLGVTEETLTLTASQPPAVTSPEA